MQSNRLHSSLSLFFHSQLYSLKQLFFIQLIKQVFLLLQHVHQVNTMTSPSYNVPHVQQMLYKNRPVLDPMFNDDMIFVCNYLDVTQCECANTTYYYGVNQGGGSLLCLPCSSGVCVRKKTTCSLNDLSVC